MFFTDTATVVLSPTVTVGGVVADPPSGVYDTSVEVAGWPVSVTVHCVPARDDRASCVGPRAGAVSTMSWSYAPPRQSIEKVN